MNRIELFWTTIAVLIAVIIGAAACGIIIWHSNDMATQMIYEKSCEKAKDMNMVVKEHINPYNPCDINWYGTVFQINYFCEKVNKPFCDFNITLLNETVFS